MGWGPRRLPGIGSQGACAGAHRNPVSAARNDGGLSLGSRAGLTGAGRRSMSSHLEDGRGWKKRKAALAVQG